MKVILIFLFCEPEELALCLKKKSGSNIGDRPFFWLLCVFLFCSNESDSLCGRRSRDFRIIHACR